MKIARSSEMYDCKSTNPQSCHEKRHLSFSGCVSFLARRFIHGNLTLFEIPNKLFVLYYFRHDQDSEEIFLFFVFFPFSFAILQLP